MKKQILITGAAGFIGSAVAKKFLTEGYDVTTIDNLSTGQISNIPEGVNFINGDCFDKNIFKKLQNYNFVAIVHIAGQSSGEISFEDPAYDLKTNTLSTLLLLKLAKNINCRKFIYASSMSVYGDQPNIPISEDRFCNPKSFYAVGKLASEQYLKIFSNQGISSTSLRLFNTYGPGQNMNNLKQGMISIYLAQAFDEKKIVVKGDINRFRDFVYIDDVVSAFYELTTSNKSDYNIFNVCTGESTTVKQVLEIIENYLPFDIQIESAGETPGDQFGIYGSPKALTESINWSPMVNIDHGIKRMIDWILNEKSKL